ncbi:unnamed protein product [Parascedosporium putredinis]|uniref:Coenzyme Q-binding protein COQ10 START domain-containing protein n=1 Tax=Parascedosporium putredinis TaxID=1442378 RepID=A0A9P1M7B6_9PEZI|nr:unnamed protein product [Parascedosporium putredinis]CAI7987523.1 unnamed protein product [Parascedosporium putredinis]
MPIQNEAQVVAQTRKSQAQPCSFSCAPPPRTLLLPSLSSSRRAFITLPGTSPAPQVLTASRLLPYPTGPLYDIISDVDSYASFVPFCSSSASPTATLRVGWGGFQDSFTSRLDCVPGSVVEAVSGSAARLIADPGRRLSTGNSAVLKSLSTRWTLEPRTVAGAEGAEVNLTIRFEFANPLYAAVSSAVSETVAAKMIEAFESHARKILGREAPARGLL